MGIACTYCEEDLRGLPFKCRYCGEFFCVKHQLPENHLCQGLEDWKAGRLRVFKKDSAMLEKEKRFLEKIKENKWVQLMGFTILIILLVIIIKALSRT